MPRLLDPNRRREGIIKRSRAQEVGSARLIGGQRVVGSGSSWSAKGDAKGPEYLVECKRTDKQSISLKRSHLLKIAVEALRAGRTPILALDIDGDEYMVLRKRDFKRLIDGK